MEINVVIQPGMLVKINPELDFNGTAIASRIAGYSIEPGEIVLAQPHADPNWIAVERCFGQHQQRYAFGYEKRWFIPAGIELTRIDKLIWNLK